MFYVFFKVLDKLIGNRVSAETEIVGLDLPEMGALGLSRVLADHQPLVRLRGAGGGN